MYFLEVSLSVVITIYSFRYDFIEIKIIYYRIKSVGTPEKSKLSGLEIIFWILENITQVYIVQHEH